jgi:hypothetical protein
MSHHVQPLRFFSWPSSFTAASTGRPVDKMFGVKNVKIGKDQDQDRDDYVEMNMFPMKHGGSKFGHALQPSSSICRNIWKLLSCLRGGRQSLGQTQCLGEFEPRYKYVTGICNIK